MGAVAAVWEIVKKTYEYSRNSVFKIGASGHGDKYPRVS